MKKKTADSTLPTRRPTTRYKADPKVGLTAEQVKEYRQNGWTNRAVESPSKSVKEIIRSNVCTYFNLIFAIIVVLLMIVGSYRDLTFLPIIAANTMIGIIQEINAKKTLDKLSVLHAPKATAIRNGKKVTLAANALVLDDIVQFSAGNQICADAVVLSGEAQVNESLLTGESDEITKRPGDKLMSGSFLVSGKCRCRLTHVGEDSYISKLTLQAKESREGEQSEIIRSLDKLVKIIGVIIVPIGILLFYQQFKISQETFKESITSMVAAVIGMIPEGLYLLASVALAVSAVRLAVDKVLVHDMKCIETLARADVLCVDKTGTITETTMKVQRIIPTKNDTSESMQELKKLIGDFAAAMEKDNSTMEAVKAYFKENHGKRAQAVTSFSSAYKYSSATFSDMSYILGAPEFVLREDFAGYREEIGHYTAQGYRLLVFASSEEQPDGKALHGKAVPLAYILLANPIRKEAAETFRYFANQGVEIKVISGDTPATVSEVARQAGIRHAEQYVDASSLKNERQIFDAAKKYTVFGRVTPNQKRAIVRALKKAGKTVAMTGDGVNDVLAFKDADCSVAMASGSDAAAQAATMVLLDNDFSKMPSVVGEGRRVVNNIQRSGSLFLVKNIFSLLLSIFSLVSVLTYPLEPAQISLISIFTIGVPAFMLSFLPNHKKIRGRFIQNIVVSALPAAITDFVIVASLVVFGQEFNVPSEDIATASTLILAIVGFMILYRISEPMDAIKWVILIGCGVAFVIFGTQFRHLFAITGMSKQCIMLLIVFSVATEPVLRYLNRLFEWASARRKR